MKAKNVIWIAIGTGLILLVPLVAMQFTDEVNWSLADFIVAGALVFGTGLAYELIVRKVQNKNRRLIVGVVLALVFLYLWAELAVGIFTTWGS
jgi:hypothetical protein